MCVTAGYIVWGGDNMTSEVLIDLPHIEAHMAPFSRPQPAFRAYHSNCHCAGPRHRLLDALREMACFIGLYFSDFDLATILHATCSCASAAVDLAAAAAEVDPDELTAMLAYGRLTEPLEAFCFRSRRRLLFLPNIVLQSAKCAEQNLFLQFIFCWQHWRPSELPNSIRSFAFGPFFFLSRFFPFEVFRASTPTFKHTS